MAGKDHHGLPGWSEIGMVPREYAWCDCPSWSDVPLNSGIRKSGAQSYIAIARAYSSLALFRMGMSGSASLQRASKFWYAVLAFALSPDSANALPSCKCAACCKTFITIRACPQCDDCNREPPPRLPNPYGYYQCDPYCRATLWQQAGNGSDGRPAAPNSPSLLGPIAEDMLREIHAGILFLGVDASICRWADNSQCSGGTGESGHGQRLDARCGCL